MRSSTLKVALAALAAGCSGLRPPGEAAPGELHGLHAPLSTVAGPALSLTLDGSVGFTRALVRLDVSSALSRIAVGCFPSTPSSRGTVRFQRTAGAKVVLPESYVYDVVVAGRRLAGRVWGIEPSVQDCVVWVGTDVLGRAVIDVDPSEGRVHISAGRPRSEYVGLAPRVDGLERAVVDLYREPTSDQLLVPARVRFGDKEVAFPFVFSTAHERSSLGAPAVAMARLPQAAGYAPRSLELAPGLALEQATLVHHPSWSNKAAAGQLGADVWGRFDTRIDLEAGVLLLTRPVKVVQGGKQVCRGSRRSEHPTEEDCVSVRAERSLIGGGWRVVVSVGADIPAGATMWLDLDSPSPCRVGFSLWPADRGVTVLAQLEGADPAWSECGALIGETASIGPGVLEADGPIEGCPGDCLMYGRGGGSDEIECLCSTYGSLTEPLEKEGQKPKKRRVKLLEAPEPADPR